MGEDGEAMMPVDRPAEGGGGSTARPASLVWVLPIGFLVGIWLWLALSSGGFPAKNWVFPALALGVVGLAIAALVLYPRRPGQLALAVLGLLAGYSIWSLASSLWAEAGQVALVGSARTWAYLLVLALALTYFTSSTARAAFRYLLMLAAFLLLVVSVTRLWTSADLTALFSGNRLVYPVGNADNAAALFLLPFWPLVWLAAGPEERAPVRGAALGIATGLLGLAVMTQSRATVWSMGATLVLLFVLSPGRLRLLLYLAVPALFMAYAFPQLNRYWTLGPAAIGGASAARTLTVALIAAGFIGMMLALLEGWIKVTGRMRVIFGGVVIAGCIAALIYGASTSTRDAGDPWTWFRNAWGELVSEPVVPGQGAPANGAGESSREAVWKDAWRQIEERPLAGAGVDNLGVPVATDSSSSPTADQPPRASASLVTQVLGDTGIIGGVLAFAAILVAVWGILWPRMVAGWRRAGRVWRMEDGLPGEDGSATAGTRSRWGDQPMAYGWNMALFCGAAFWFLHANTQWLWQTAGVTVPALLMLAAAVAATDARAGIFWATARTREGGEESERQETISRPFRRLRPRGLVSQAFRIGLIVLSAGVVVLAVWAYITVR